mgnify:CR=1 FL=1
MESKTIALEVHDLTIAYRDRPVLWNVDFQIESGQLIAIVGPNGAGKSTLLKGILGFVPLASGWVSIFGRSLTNSRSRIAYVPQRESVDWDFPVTAYDVVMMGRYGRLGWLKRPSKEDHSKVKEVLDRVGMGEFSKRQISELSGGQQQRIFIARALVQEADLYIMDEPFAGVDAATERSLVELLRSIRESGRTVIAVHHDLQTVQEYFDGVILLNVHLVAAGRTEQVFSRENLIKTYGGRLTLLEQVRHEMNSNKG